MDHVLQRLHAVGGLDQAAGDTADLVLRDATAMRMLEPRATPRPPITEAISARMSAI